MRKLLIVLLAVCLLLSGCAVEADRIYTVCRIDNGTRYVYDGSGNFYTILEDGSLQPNIDPSLINKPALQLRPKEGPFNFEKVLPGLYNGTLQDINHYVYRICSDLTSIQTIYSDPNRLEIIVPTTEASVRILFNIRGDIRIYFSNDAEPLYLNGE